MYLSLPEMHDWPTEETILEESEQLLQCLQAEEIEQSFLPSVITDYLDLLLQSSTECPERHMSEFECVKCLLGQYELLVPLSRLQNIVKNDKPNRFCQIEIPECDSEGSYVMSLHEDTRFIKVDAVGEVIWVQSEDILWRDSQTRAPWFVGTHKNHLCRIFDPNFLIANW